VICPSSASRETMIAYSTLASSRKKPIRDILSCFSPPGPLIEDVLVASQSLVETLAVVSLGRSVFKSTSPSFSTFPDWISHFSVMEDAKKKFLRPYLPKTKNMGPLTNILISVFFSTISVSLIVPSHPQLLTQVFCKNDYASSAKLYGWQMSVIALLQFLSTPILGLWSDRIRNRRRVLLLQGAVTTLAYVMLTAVSYFGAPSSSLSSASDGDWWRAVLWIAYLVSRFLTGIMGNLFMIALTYIGDLSDDQSKSSNFGLVGMSGGLAFTFGPAMSALASRFISSQLYFSFLMAAVCCLTGFLFSVFNVEDSIELMKKKKNANQPELSTTSADEEKNNDSGIWSLLKDANPLKSFSILFSNGPSLMLLSVVTLLFGLGNSGFFSIWINYANHRYKFTSYESGLFLTGIGIGYAIVQGRLMKLFVRVLGEHKAAVFALLASSLTYLGLGLANEGWMTYAVIPVASFASMSDPLLKGIGSKQVDSTKQGTLQGAMSSLITISAVVSPVMLAYVFSMFSSVDAPIKNFIGAPFFLCSLCVLVSCLIMLLFVPTQKKIESDERKKQ